MACRDNSQCPAVFTREDSFYILPISLLFPAFKAKGETLCGGGENVFSAELSHGVFSVE